jgi:hypothetical protein
VALLKNLPRLVVDDAIGELAAELHTARKKIAEECGYDFRRLVERYKRMQAENPELLVDHVPKSDPESLPT